MTGKDTLISAVPESSQMGLSLPSRFLILRTRQTIIVQRQPNFGMVLAVRSCALQCPGISELFLPITRSSNNALSITTTLQMRTLFNSNPVLKKQPYHTCLINTSHQPAFIQPSISINHPVFVYPNATQVMVILHDFAPIGDLFTAPALVQQPPGMAPQSIIAPPVGLLLRQRHCFALKERNTRPL